MRKIQRALCPFAVALAAACGGAQEPAAQPSSAATPTDAPMASPGSTGEAPASGPNTSVGSPKTVGTPTPCTPKQVMAGDKCFDNADDACASIGCARPKCNVLETAPAKAVCKP